MLPEESGGVGEKRGEGGRRVRQIGNKEGTSGFHRVGVT